MKRLASAGSALSDSKKAMLKPKEEQTRPPSQGIQLPPLEDKAAKQRAITPKTSQRPGKGSEDEEAEKLAQQ
jgi:hypothetical protein